MSKMHSSGSVERVGRLQNIPSEARFAPRGENGIAHPRAPRPGLARANPLPGVVPATTAADCEKMDRWSWVIASFIQGFALYGASFHGIASFPVDPHPAETAAAEPEENSFHARRRYISLVPSPGGPGVRATEFEGGADPVAPGLGKPPTINGAAGRQRIASFEFGRPNRWHWLISCSGVVAAPWRHWRREREIKKSVAALAGLDDQTLRDMGIPQRSQIEQAVRYCHDC
jgi:uncharacterized protein YjiS (DUF1127 family)